MTKSLNLKLVIFLEYQSLKTLLQTTLFLSDLKSEKIVGTFDEKELQKTNQKQLRAEKVKREKMINCMLYGKDTIISLIAG